MIYRGVGVGYDLAEAFKGAGYKTALFGKWHLGAHVDHGPTPLHGEERYAFLVIGDTQYVGEKSRQPARLDPYSEEASVRFIEHLNKLPGQAIPDALGRVTVSNSQHPPLLQPFQARASSV